MANVGRGDLRSTRHPALDFLARKLHRPPQAILQAGAITLAATLLLGAESSAPLLCNLVSFLLAIWRTITHLSKVETDVAPPNSKKAYSAAHSLEGKRLLDIWVGYGTSVIVEDLLGTEIIFSLFPLWWLTKVVLIWWLLLDDSSRSKEAVRLGRHAPTPLQIHTQDTRGMVNRSRNSAITDSSGSHCSSEAFGDDEEEHCEINLDLHSGNSWTASRPTSAVPTYGMFEESTTTSVEDKKLEVVESTSPTPPRTPGRFSPHLGSLVDTWPLGYVPTSGSSSDGSGEEDGFEHEFALAADGVTRLEAAVNPLFPGEDSLSVGRADEVTTLPTALPIESPDHSDLPLLNTNSLDDKQNASALLDSGGLGSTIKKGQRPSSPSVPQVMGDERVQPLTPSSLPMGSGEDKVKDGVALFPGTDALGTGVTQMSLDQLLELVEKEEQEFSAMDDAHSSGGSTAPLRVASRE